MWNPNELTPIGQTYAQIDEKMGDEVRQANKQLELLSRFGARWWNYTVSHNSFELLIGDPSGKQNIVLFLGACSHISGPVDWRVQKLKIEWFNSPPAEDREWSFTVSDDSVGFKAEAKAFSWSSNYNLLDRKIADKDELSRA